jgi:acyl-CoA synthetase (AMP-forming)/AMP-acid ligase II
VRRKDMLKVSRENADPVENKGLQLQYPEVNQVVVIGLADEQMSKLSVAEGSS